MVSRSVFSPGYSDYVRPWSPPSKLEGSPRRTWLALGRSHSFVSKYERGERRLDLVEVIEIASVLDVDACDPLREVSGFVPVRPQRHRFDVHSGAAETGRLCLRHIAYEVVRPLEARASGLSARRPIRDAHWARAR
jgi:transcriptional regulator with XRE-family HTH domain